MTQSPPWRHPAVALLLPAMLIALGAWQLTRIAHEADGYAARDARLQASIASMLQMVGRDPNAVVRFNGMPGSYTATEALARLRDTGTQLSRDILVERARQSAARVTIGAAAIALLAVLGCLGLAAVSARRSRASRTTLVAAFRSVVRVLPTLLALVAVPTALAVCTAVLFEAGGAWFLDSISTGEVKLLLLGLVVVFGVVAYAVGTVHRLFRSLAAFKPKPVDVLGRAADPATAPGLWAFVRQVAAGQGADAPDNIVLGMTDGFYVTSAAIRLLPEDRPIMGRSLYVPAPFLPLLSRNETTAIVAHELAHFTGEDTVFSEHFLPLYAGMGRSMDAVTAANGNATWLDAVFQPAAILARHVMATFARVVAHWSRLRELEADRASLQAADSQAAASALLRTGIGAGLINRAMDDMYQRPAASSPDLVGTVLASAGTTGFQDPARYLQDRQPHPTDSHPPTRQRIEALGVPVDDTLFNVAGRPLHPEDAAFTASLFNDWPGLRNQLGADLLATAHAYDRKLKTRLQEAAAAVTTDIPIHEASKAAAISLAGIGAMFAMGGSVAVWLVFGTNVLGPRDTILGLTPMATLVVMGAAILAVAWFRNKRAKAGPFLVVGPEGFRSIGIDGLVPWSGVDDIRVVTGRSNLTRFHFNKSAIMPRQTGYRWSVKVDPKKRSLLLKGFTPRGMEAQAYLDLLNSALRAHQAAVVLREREAAQ